MVLVGTHRNSRTHARREAEEQRREEGEGVNIKRNKTIDRHCRVHMPSAVAGVDDDDEDKKQEAMNAWR